MRPIAPLLLAGATAAATLSFPAAAHRQLGAHEHGRGTLNIAIEGSKVTMELEAPGMDIVGFEHVAKSKGDEAAVEKARGRLMEPLALFVLPAAAGCRVIEAKVEIEGGGEAKTSSRSEDHAEFHAEYALECQSPAGITGIEFPYFRTFARAQKLEVNLVTSKGQSKFEVSRARPSLGLAGMI
jgi:hypothetical protein